MDPIIQYEDKNTCFIKAELTDSSNFEVVLNDVVEQINNTLCPLNPADINYYALSMMWQQFAIILSYKGQSLAGLAWILPVDYFLYDGIKGEAMAAWQRLPRFISREKLAGVKLGYKDNNIFLQEFINVKDKLDKLTSIIGHLGNFDRAEEYINDTGQEVYNEYVHGLTPTLTRAIEEAQTSIVNMKSNKCLTDNMEFFDILLGGIYPFDDDDFDETTIFTPEVFVSWRDLLLKLHEELFSRVISHWMKG